MNSQKNYADTFIQHVTSVEVSSVGHCSFF